MGKVVFNQNDPKQVGAMGLHILGINDMPVDKWLSYFTSEGMKNCALKDEQGFIERLPPHLKEKAVELLTHGEGGMVTTISDGYKDESLTGLRVSMPDTTFNAKAPVRSAVKETVVTDKGTLTSVESLRQKLSGIYSIQDFGKVWVEALTLAGLDADIEYVSNTGKKRVLSAMKAAIVSVVENTVDNI